MSLLEQLLLILGLAMDGFAASVCMGLSMKEHKRRLSLLAVGLVTGFHVLMFAGGHLFGRLLARGGVALGFLPGLLLTALGLPMIFGSRQEEKTEALGPGRLLALAFGTSVDAMTVGLSFALMGQPLPPAAGLVAVVMGLLSVTGLSFGRFVGRRFRCWAERGGGLILCLLGVKNILGL